MKVDKRLLIILIIQITEVLGFSLVLPFLPFYAEDLGATPFVVGLIIASFSIFQFISAPIMGKLSDFYGRKPLLLFSQASTCLGFLILAFSNSLWMIFLSRIVDGLLGSNFSIAQAYLSDISTKKDRSKVFGISGVAFGIGFLIGPAIGGFLSRYGYSIPSFMAAGICLITMTTTLIFLPETVKRKKEFKLKIKILDISSFKKYFSETRVSSKLGQFFTYILAHVIWVSSFALYAKRQLGFTPVHVGYLLTYIGFISIFIRGIFLGKLINFFGENKLKIVGSVSIIIGLIGAIFISEGWTIFIIMTLFAFGTGVSRPVLIGEISRSVSPKEQGAILGLTNSLGSLSQIFGPLIGGFLISNFFPGSLSLVAALVMSLGLIMILRNNSSRKIFESRLL